MKVLCKSRRANVQLKLAVGSRYVSTQDVARFRIQRIRIIGDATRARCGDGPPGKIQWQLKSRMHVESLHHRRRDNGISAGVADKQDRVLHSLFSTYTVRRTSE